MIVIALPGQTLFDVALQYYGAIDAVFKLAEDNGITDITSPLNSGIEMVIDESYSFNKNVSDYYSKNGVNISTSLKAEQKQGIGYSAIETNFVIS
ncbi:MAG: LysM domain-containing protein [Bacteroidetes bacterium]|nr:LysM domain-containing protein [Bacteroidota bacterium]